MKQKKIKIPAMTALGNRVSVKKRKDIALFSEIEVLLRSLDRFLNTENIPVSKDSPADRNFFNELSAVKDVILRIIGLLERIIPRGRRNMFLLYKNPLTEDMSERQRDAFIARLYKQDKPEKSLIILYESFNSFKEIIAGIMKSENISYPVYTGIGRIIRDEIRGNIHFNPFKGDFNPEFDIIGNKTASDVVKGIKNRLIKRHVSANLLYLFRFIRYLSYTDASSKSRDVLNSSLIIISSLRSEIKTFRNYMNEAVDKLHEKKLKTLIESISFQFSIESKRVFMQETEDIFRNRSLQYLRNMIRSSRGILKNLSEQGIVQIVQFFNPDLKSTDIFQSFLTRIEKSERLRDDALIFKQLLNFMISANTPEERLHIFIAMTNFMNYFKNDTFKLLRYHDHEEFASFFKKLPSFKKRGIIKEDMDQILKEIENFMVFLDAWLCQISNRSELTGRDADKKMIENRLKHYLI